MYVCVWICAHGHACLYKHVSERATDLSCLFHACTLTWLCMYTYTCTCTCGHTHTPFHVHQVPESIHSHAHTRVYSDVQMHTYMNVYIEMYKSSHQNNNQRTATATSSRVCMPMLSVRMTALDCSASWFSHHVQYHMLICTWHLSTSHIHLCVWQPQDFIAFRNTAPTF